MLSPKKERRQFEVLLRQLASSMSFLSFLSNERFARFRLPSSGSLGHGSPPSRPDRYCNATNVYRNSIIAPGRRYYAPLRLPLPISSASLVARFGYPDGPRFVWPTTLVTYSAKPHQSARTPRLAQGNWYAGYPNTGSLSRRKTDLTSFRANPLGTCPALRPRWSRGPVVKLGPRLLPSSVKRLSAVPASPGVIHNDLHFGAE